MSKGQVSKFIERNYLHFNAATLVDAAKAYEQHLNAGGKMMITLAGAMSTAELGISLAEMIRKDKVQIISCTGANLEEDMFNLVAHGDYKRIPNYRDLKPQDEWDLLQHGFSRVTDTCITEKAMYKIEHILLKYWKEAQERGKRYLPHEYFYQLLLSDELRKNYHIDAHNSWLLAAAEKNIPIVVPGWEDSTLGNAFASYCLSGQLIPSTMKSGIEYMVFLADWYIENCKGKGIGLFQIGGGISGHTSARFLIPRQVTGHTPVPVQMKKSLGEKLLSTPPDTLSNQMQL